MNWDIMIAKLRDTNTNGRLLKVRVGLGRQGSPMGVGNLLLVNYYNMPTERALENRGGGAEAENNRMSFTITQISPDRFKLEHCINALPCPRLRGRTGSAASMVKALRQYIEGVAKNQPPKLTHE